MTVSFDLLNNTVDTITTTTTTTTSSSYDDCNYYKMNDVHYVKEDYERIRKENEETLKFMMTKSSRSSDEDEDEYCPRGLEARTVLGSKKRKSNKSRGLKVVLEEQRRQISEKGYVYNMDIIAEAYSGYSKSCHYQASKVGKQDEGAAKQILTGEIEVWRRKKKQQQQQQSYMIQNRNNSVLIPPDMMVTNKNSLRRPPSSIGIGCNNGIDSIICINDKLSKIKFR